MKIEKLSNVDFGEFSYLETKDNNKSVYFIGKIIKDGNGYRLKVKDFPDFVEHNIGIRV